MSFWGELKRRNVFKVGAAYLIAAWLIVQVVSIAFPAFHMPEWTVTFVMSLLIIGFFVSIILAWAYEVTPDGVKLTKKVPLADSITHATGRKLNYILAGLLIVAVGYIVVDKALTSRNETETEPAALQVTEKTPTAPEVKDAPKTIAVLPFDDLSPDKDQEYFVDGLSEEILNSLTQIPGLTVIAKTSSFSFKGKDKTIPEIASILGVDHILEGSVRKAGNALRITAQLVKAVDGSHLWSKTYDKEYKVEEMFSVQEDIANNVADKLKLTLEAFNLVGGTDNVEAYELFLDAKGKFSEDTTSAMTFALESINAAIALDQKFALAWAIKAFFHSRLSIIGPANRALEERDAALHAVLKSIEIEPYLADGHFQLGWMKTTGGNWIEAETSYRRAFKLTTEQFPEYSPYPLHYFAVGYFAKAKNLLKSYLQVNPFNQNMRSFYMMDLGILGDFQGAEEEYGNLLKLFGDRIRVEEQVYLSFMGGDNVFSIDDMPNTSLYYSQFWNILSKYLESPEEGLLELKKVYAHDENLTTIDFMRIALFAAYFGDPEFALKAMKKELRINAVDFVYVWLPIMHDVRQLPRFKQLVREIGLVDYWEQFGWPDICHKLDNGDFVCD